MLAAIASLALGALALSVAATPAAAQTVATHSRDEEARGLFLAGRAAFDDARFLEALEHFERSYALSGRAELLYNVGLAAERAGNAEKAMGAFERFVVERPDGPQAPDARERLAALARAAELRSAAESDTARAPREAAPVADPQPELPAPAPARSPSALPWIVGGTGLAVTVTGVALLAVGLSDASRVTNAAQGSAWSDVEPGYERTATLQTLGVVMLGVGLAAVGTGVTLLLFGAPDEGSARLALGPGTLTLRGTF